MCRVLHYKHPVLGYHSCGMGSPHTVEMTGDLSQVTCQRCLGTVTGQKASNRQIGDRPKQEIKMRLDADLREQLKRQSQDRGVSQVSIVEAALKAYLN